MNFLLKLLLVHLVIEFSLAVEWSTSSGKYCTRKCTTKKEGNYQVYWCPAVDGKDDDSSGSEVPGDYCTPSVLPQQTTPSSTVRPVTLPATLSPTTTQGSVCAQVICCGSNGVKYPTPCDAPVGVTCVDYNPCPGGSGLNPGTSKSMSSMKGFPCFGACAPAAQSQIYECPIKDHPTKPKFFCSLSTEKLERKQVSSKKKMWCMTECSGRNEDGKTIYKCNTMGGEDLCSPSDKKSYKDNKCTSRCSLHKGKGDHKQEYMCSVDEDKKKMESCGFWGKQDKSIGGREMTKSVDFTDNDQVCAGPCEKGKCLFVEWTKKSSDQKLKVKEGNCGITASGSIMRMAPLSLIVFLGALLKLNV